MSLNAPILNVIIMGNKMNSNEITVAGALSNVEYWNSVILSLQDKTYQARQEYKKACKELREMSPDSYTRHTQQESFKLIDM